MDLFHMQPITPDCRVNLTAESFLASLSSFNQAWARFRTDQCSRPEIGTDFAWLAQSRRGHRM